MAKKSAKLEAELRLVARRHDARTRLIEFVNVRRDIRNRLDLSYGSSEAQAGFRFSYHGSGTHNMHFDKLNVHERRQATPLRRIRGFAELLAETGYLISEDRPEWDYTVREKPRRQNLILPATAFLNGCTVQMWAIGADRLDLLDRVRRGAVSPDYFKLLGVLTTPTDPMIVLAVHTAADHIAVDLRSNAAGGADGIMGGMVHGPGLVGQRIA